MTAFRKTSHLACRTIAGRAYIVDTASSVLHELDEVGTLIWSLIDDHGTPEEIGRRVSDSFDVSRPEATKDAAAFLRQLESLGLVRRND